MTTTNEKGCQLRWPYFLASILKAAPASRMPPPCSDSIWDTASVNLGHERLNTDSTPLRNFSLSIKQA